jgi:dihydrofolate reductase
MNISIIVATSKENCIGKDNKLLWNISEDLKHFKSITMNHHIIMGRRTFESIGKPLPGRTSIIISRQEDYLVEKCIIVNSLEKAIEKAKNDTEIFIIGGGQIYKDAIKYANKIYLTKINHSFEGDTFFPIINPEDWELKEQQSFEPNEKNPYCYSFITLYRR